MADITRFPLVSATCARSRPTTSCATARATSRATAPASRSGSAPINTAVAEVPVDDRELPFLFRVRSADFQELTVQGVITLPRRRSAEPRPPRGLHARPEDRPLGAGAARAGRRPALPARPAVRGRRAGQARRAHDPRTAASRRSATGSRTGLAQEPALHELGIAARGGPRRRPRADRRAGEGAAPADPRGDPAARRRGHLRAAARWPSRRSARSRRTSSPTASS